MQPYSINFWYRLGSLIVIVNLSICQLCQRIKDSKVKGPNYAKPPPLFISSFTYRILMHPVPENKFQVEKYTMAHFYLFCYYTMSSSHFSKKQIFLLGEFVFNCKKPKILNFEFKKNFPNRKICFLLKCELDMM